VFVDASPKAYGAVAYLTNGNQSSPIMAKSRVAPLKELTLPQLELMAAVVGTRLANFLFCTLFPNLRVKLWSDSEIVLHWINSSKTTKAVHTTPH
jgi:ribonuclease HI